MSYRDRIYGEYASKFQDSDLVFDTADAERRALSIRQYLRGWLPEDKSAAIVDVACGNGSLLHVFKSFGYANLRGVDLSAEQVTLAKQVTPNVAQGDALEFLQAHPASFDLIVGMDIIEHLRKDEVLTFLDRCAAALRPGGRLVLQTPNADSPMFNTVRYGDLTHEGAFTPDILTRLMRRTGLTSIEARETGPVVHGAKSLARQLLWQCIRGGVRLWNIAESGSAGSGVYTRVFVISGVKA
ncbi:MAG TPA: class I SAM-dependent methyltransferase [Polyangiales bacterium]|jgi:2-polyprenyl-3-methyl-5-hydroxy-6-metoxy-1,4-benzoquinol methylase|nr:class I SAM-dependent methyltransferase [Polyangiales bacterium]